VRAVAEVSRLSGLGVEQQPTEPDVAGGDAPGQAGGDRPVAVEVPRLVTTEQGREGDEQ
jgi:hypothetical protein